MKPKAASNPRVQVIRALHEVLDEGFNLTDAPALQDSRDARDLSFARHLSYGVIRWKVALDWLAQQLLSKPLKDRDQDIYRLILLGLHQLWQDRTADHAAIHETAECARHIKKPWAVGLINAILRRFQRERDTWLEQLGKRVERYAHPGWMVDRIREDWPDQWESILDANNQTSPMWLRLNRLGPPAADLVERLEDQGFEVTRHRFAADAAAIQPAANVHSLSGFSHGHFSVQDPAAQLAADLVAAETGMRVLDACAAPGGKTCHLLERTSGIRLTAIEINPGRIRRITENLQRNRLQCDVVTGDATQPGDWWDGKPFQRILLDAPCSASGVIRRHPEIKHLRDPAQVTRAAELQSTLLNRLWPLLQPDGMLIYATCSIFLDENTRQIGKFMAQNSDAIEIRPAVEWGRPLEHGRQVLPGEESMDGFYYAVVRKQD